MPDKEIRADKKWCYDCKNYYTTTFCGYNASHCRIHGSLDMDQKERHHQSCKNGSRFIYDLQGTGIGTIVKIKCPICGKEEDITDLDSW